MAGNVLATTQHRLKLQLTDAEYRQDLRCGILFRESVAPRDKMTTPRVVVEDPATSVAGSLIIPAREMK